MAPRKRKAQLAAIREDAPEAGVAHVDAEEPGPSAPARRDADPEQASSEELQRIIDECKEQIREKADQLVQAARQRSEQLRSDMEAVFPKLTRKVLNVSAAEFFQLSMAEGAATTLSDMLQRLRQLGSVSVEHAAVAGAVNAALGARGVAGPSAAAPAEAESGAGDAGTSAAEAQAPSAEPPAARNADAAGPSTAKEVSVPAASALMPPPPPRPATQAQAAGGAQAAAAAQPRQPGEHDTVVYSANGSPIYLSALPARGGGAAEPATAARHGIADATPAVGFGAPAAAAAPPTIAFTGRTFRLGAGGRARGRTKQATRCVTVTCADGKTFAVDDLIGLAAVPERYREEVRQLVEADLQDLSALVTSVAAMEAQPAAGKQPAGKAAAGKAAAARPTRRG